MEKEIKDKKILFNRNSKNIWKFLILIFIFNVIIFNWDDIYWVFNPRVGPRGIQTLIERNETNQEIKEGDFYDKEDTIKIPMIDIEAPIIFSNPTTDEEFEKAMKKGVVHYPESVLPGENGTSIILGHSAPENWPKIDYEWVFSDLEKLKEGDSIKIYFKNQLYHYVVQEKVFLEVGEGVPSYGLNEPELVLLSCWPPGKNIKRIGIRAVLDN